MDIKNCPDRRVTQPCCAAESLAGFNPVKPLPAPMTSLAAEKPRRKEAAERSRI